MVSMLQAQDIDWLNRYKNKTCIYAVYKKLTQAYGHIQTESEGMEKNIPCKWKLEKQPENN